MPPRRSGSSGNPPDAAVVALSPAVDTNVGRTHDERWAQSLTPHAATSRMILVSHAGPAPGTLPASVPHVNGPSRRERTVRRWSFAAAAYAVVLLLGLLAPFDTYRPNDATWLHEGGLEFRETGMARSATPPARLHRRLVATGALTVEVVVDPARAVQWGPARLVSYSEDTSRRNFTLGQEGAALQVRLRTTQSDANGHPSLTVEDVFGRPGPRHIVVTYDGTDEHVYVDGMLRRSSRARRGSFESWDPEHVLVFGNEASGTRPWRGRLALVAIYDRALGRDEVAANHASRPLADGVRVADGLVALYRFGQRDGPVRDESGLSPPLDLALPRSIGPPDRFLDTDREYLRGRLVPGEAWEIAVNLAIFVPLGFLVARAALASTAGPLTVAALTLSLGVLLSLGAETVQYFVASRYSELGDVLLNGISTLLGLLLALAVRGRRRTPV